MTNLEAAQEAEAAGSPAAGAAGSVNVPKNESGLASETIFNMMGAYCAMGEGASAVKTANATFGFDVTLKKGGKPVLQYSIDLKNGGGSVTKGAVKGADAYFTMTDADFVKLCQGKANGQTMFMQGKMKIKGNMAAATRFTPDLFPPPTEENLAKLGLSKL